LALQKLLNIEGLAIFKQLKLFGANVFKLLIISQFFILDQLSIKSNRKIEMSQGTISDLQGSFLDR
jgi:hypothetical protein